MDMRNKEDRESLLDPDNRACQCCDDALYEIEFLHLQQLIDMADENEKLKEQIAFYQRERI